VEAAFNMGQLTMRLTDPGNATANRTKLFPQLETTTAVIFVFDLSSSCGEALLQYESTVNSHWLRNSSIIVIFNNVKGFAKRLAEAPLRDEFPDYVGGDDATNASNYLFSRIKHLNRADLRQYVHFIDGMYDERNLWMIWRNIQDVIISRALKSFLPR
jgi:guanine nucleotide-binding protein G(i) subunit alpha